MPAPIDLERYQILVAPDSKKTQGLRTGDIVRRQYRDDNNLIYSLMCVLSNGTVQRTATEAAFDSEGNPILDGDGNIVTYQVNKDVPYFIGALLEGTAPQTKELLDFVRITNLFDTDRSGALYLTASDDQAPYMDIIDGIGRNKSLCWPENIMSEAFEDSKSQYIVRGDGLAQEYIPNEGEHNRIVRLTRTSATNTFSGLSQDFYELVQAQKIVLVSYKAKANKQLTVNAEVAYATGGLKDAEWTETLDTNWQYCFRAINVINSGRHIRSFHLDLKDLGINDWVEIADFNIILLDSISNFGEATAMRLGKLDGVVDPVFGALSGYGAYIQKLYASQTAHISGTLTAGDENGFASTFYAGKIHRNCFVNSCTVTFQDGGEKDNTTLANPTGMGNVYKIRNSGSVTMQAQSRSWLNDHIGKRYCFSFWGYAKKPCQINIQQNGKSIKTIQITPDNTHEWCRLNGFFDIIEPEDAEEKLLISLVPSFYNSPYTSIAGSVDIDEPTLFFTAPQLESGEYCTQYQPTDDILDETEDYGAWFARGGIGGTIQNPLLRLNYDGTGAIDTRTNSFRLNQDGSGFLANENIKWNSSGHVTFGNDVTLNWDNFSDSAQDEMANRYMRIVGNDTFTVLGQEDASTYSPASITLGLSEVGFTSTSSQRQWYIKRSTGFQPLPDENGASLYIDPDSDWWNGESYITLRCDITLNESRTYSDTFTVKKIYVQGYSVIVTSSKGVSFHNGQCSTVLTAHVYYQGQLVDADYVRSHFTFTWKRYKTSDLTAEVPFTDYDTDDSTPDTVYLNYALDGSDIFVCELGTADHFDYSFPVIF